MLGETPEPDTTGQPVRVSLIGTGFIARGLSQVLGREPGMVLSRVLTRRPLRDVSGIAGDPAALTTSFDDLVEHSDLVIECSGDPVHATAALLPVVAAGIPVVTMDSEFQVTTGSFFSRQGYITEAEGDQPGSLAALALDMTRMGFEPVVYGNIKGYLNLDPSPQDMDYWSRRNGISLAQVTSFTDGTKVQIEQALVANGLGAGIVKQGLAGLRCDDFEDGAQELARLADELGYPISDYVIPKSGPPGVFAVGRHDPEQAPYLKYYKLGEGPHYVLTRPFHLCHLEIMKTVRAVLAGEKPLLDNGTNPTVSVATLAKKDMTRGTKISRAIGSFEFRGEAILRADAPDHLPIGLAQDMVLTRSVERGQVVTFADVELPDSEALAAWRSLDAPET